MVTGAGGSIGSEICRQVAAFQSRELVLVGRGENRIFKMERKLQALRTATTALFLHRQTSPTGADAAASSSSTGRRSSSTPPPTSTCR